MTKIPAAKYGLKYFSFIEKKKKKKKKTLTVIQVNVNLRFVIIYNPLRFMFKCDNEKMGAYV